MSELPQIRHAGALRVAGFSVRTSNAIESTESGRIAGLWQEFMTRKAELPHAGAPVSVYHDYESDHTGEYSLLVGCPLAPSQPAPEGWSLIEVPPAEYLVFPVEGEIPAALVSAWMGVWETFSDASKPVQRTFRYDVERHGEKVELWIGVRATGG